MCIFGVLVGIFVMIVVIVFIVCKWGNLILVVNVIN